MGKRFFVCDVQNRVIAKFDKTDRDKAIDLMTDSNKYGAKDAHVKPYYVHDTAINEKVFASPDDVKKYVEYHKGGC